MIFFQTTPNVLLNEKARIEFLTHFVASYLGVEKTNKPVVSVRDLGLDQSSIDSGQVLKFVGDHLEHDTGNIQIQNDLPILTKGGGGG